MAGVGWGRDCWIDTGRRFRDVLLALAERMAIPRGIDSAPLGGAGVESLAASTILSASEVAASVAMGVSGTGRRRCDTDRQYYRRPIARPSDRAFDFARPNASSLAPVPGISLVRRRQGSASPAPSQRTVFCLKTNVCENGFSSPRWNVSVRLTSLSPLQRRVLREIQLDCGSFTIAAGVEPREGQATAAPLAGSTRIATITSGRAPRQVAWRRRGYRAPEPSSREGYRHARARSRPASAREFRRE